MKCLFVHVQAQSKQYQADPTTKLIVEAHAPEAYGSLIVFFKAYRQRDKQAESY